MYEIRDINDPTLLNVTISAVPDVTPPAAHLTYVPAVLHAHPGERILWSCDNAPFVIQFLQSAPLGKVHYHSIGNQIGPIPVPPGAPHGCHRYAVAVCSGPTVYIDAECPEIIIED